MLTDLREQALLKGLLRLAVGLIARASGRLGLSECGLGVGERGFARGGRGLCRLCLGQFCGALALRREHALTNCNAR